MERPWVDDLPGRVARGTRSRPLPATASRAQVAGEVLASVQLLRSAAALAVVCWHLVWVSRAFPGALPEVPGALGFGYAGVDLFFAISGFVICHITEGRRFAAGRFAARRWLRIAPLYWLFTGLAALVAWLKPAWGGEQLTTANLLHSFSLLPMRENPFLGVGWSLEHEMIFYAIAGGLLAAGAGRWLPHVLALLFSVGVVLHGFLPELAGRRVFDAHLFSLYHVEFLAGVLVYHHRRALAVLGWRAPLFAGAVGVLLVSSGVAALYGGTGAAFPVPTQPSGFAGVIRVVGYGVCSGLLLLGMLEAERSGALGRMPRRLRATLCLIGDASFVLYLGHFFVYSALAKIFAALGVPGSLAVPALVSALAAAVTFALAVHVSIERPLLRAIRARVR